MHIDENKRFDKRNVERNVKNGIITPKDYEIYLSKLPDVSDKLFDPEKYSVDSDEGEEKVQDKSQSKKKAAKKKSRGKGK